MTHRFFPVRLFFELLLIVALAEGLVMVLLPYLAPGGNNSYAELIDVLLLLLLAGPFLYWRLLAALERARLTANASNRATRVSNRSQNMRRAMALTASSYCVGMALTVAGVLWQKRGLDAEAQVQFGQAASRLETEVLRRFGTPVYGMKGARGVFAASSQVDRSEFKEYVDSRNIATEFPGLRGFGFIARVQRQDLARFMVNERADGAPDFAVQTSGTAPDLFVIKFIEPLANNVAAWGLDVGQDPVRRQGAEQAMNTGQPTLTGKIVLAQDGSRSPGFLYFLPVYRRGTDPSTPAERQAALVGLLYAPIVATELLEGVVSPSDLTLSFSLFDSDDPDALIYQKGGTKDSAPGTAAAAQRNSLTQDKLLAVGGRKLTLRVSATPFFALAQDRSGLTSIALIGALASFLMALATWLLVVGRLRAQGLADRMTADLDRMARVVQHTDNAVTIADVKMHITWVNAGFTRLTGYTMEEALGKTPGELLGTGKANPETLHILALAMTMGEPCRVEVLNRAKDGREYWVDTEVQPTRDAQGVLVGFMEIGRDITVIKHAQQRLGESEAFLDRAGRIAGVGGWRVNLRDSSVYWSAEIRRIHQVADDFVPTFDQALQFYAPEARPVLEAAVQNGIDTGQGWDLELPLVTAKGQSIWVRSVGEVEFENDVAVMLLGAFQDITERRVRDGERYLLEASIARINDSILITSAKQLKAPGPQIVYVNPAFERLTGYAASEALGQAPRMLQGPGTDRATLDRIGQALEHGEAVSEELLNYAKDGRPYWIQITISPIRSGSGELTHFVAVSRDITELRQREAALRTALASAEQSDAEVRQAQAVLTSSIEALDDAFVLYDANDRLLLCNQRYRDYYPEVAEMLVPGNTFEQIIRFGAERGHYGVTDGQADAWVTERMALHRKPNSRSQQRLPSGQVLRVVERRTDAGLYVGFRIDITDLVKATESAEEASRSKSQFLANMSHEIRTPMNAILGMLKLLQNTQLSAPQQDYASKTEGAARSLLGLLNDILDFSKVEAGKMTLDPRPFRIDRLLRDLSVILSANLGQKHVEVLFDVDPTLPKELVGDDMRLQQVLINLGGNAIKFTSQGEVVLRLRLVAQTNSQVTVEFAVKDSGIGIAPENQGHIFTGFSQAEASTTRKFGGTGLGLAISNRLAGLMGSGLKLQSALGEGSTFYFEVNFGRVPAPELALTTTVEAVTPPQIVLAMQRTLVVDDNPIALDLLVHMVRSLGWQADAAASGPQAIALVQEALAKGLPYQAIFMDWQMPTLDGWQTSQRIRELTTGPDTAEPPVIMMVTAHGRDMLSQRTAQEQTLLNGYLVKPVTASMLFDAIVNAHEASQTAAAGHNPLALQVVIKPQRLKGLRLLVVEDNKINQLVAQGLLSAEGAEVTLADDGQLGVDTVAHSKPPFDVVLMDLQMPVMDGYTATQIIRQELGMKDLPIIAMTANAMASDRAACLAAGMNDHVGKPFELDHLVAVLLRYSQRLPDVSVVPSPHAQLVGSPNLSHVTSAIANTAAITFVLGDLDLEGALARLGGNTAMLSKVLQSFAKDLPQVPVQLSGFLQDALQTGVMTEVIRMLHTLKGLSATVGARHLADKAAALEQRCKTEVPLAEHADLVAKLRTAVQATADSIQKALVQLMPADITVPSTHSAQLDRAALSKDLLQLTALLKAFDMQSLAVFEHIRQAHGVALSSALEPLDAAMATLEFDLAAQHCAALDARFCESSSDV